MLSASQLLLFNNARCASTNNAGYLYTEKLFPPPPSYESICKDESIIIPEAVGLLAAGVLHAAENVDSHSKIYNKVAWFTAQAATIIEKIIVGILKAIYCTIVILISVSLGLVALHLEVVSSRSNILPALMPIVGATCKKLLGYAISTSFLDPYIA